MILMSIWKRENNIYNADGIFYENFVYDKRYFYVFMSIVVHEYRLYFNINVAFSILLIKKVIIVQIN